MHEEILFDGGSFRLYDNRLEVTRGWLFKRIDVIYYSDIAGINATKKQLVIKKAAMKNAVILQFRKKEQTQEALSIINSHKQ